VLCGVDLDLAPGEVVALAGHSGAGKSTLTALLLRLYEPTSGSMLLDGCDVRDLDPRWLRAQIALVPQDRCSSPALSPRTSRSAGPTLRPRRSRPRPAPPTAWDFVVRAARRPRDRVGERASRSRVASASASRSHERCCATPRAAARRGHERARRGERAPGQRRAAAADARAHDLIIAHRLSTLRTARRVVVLDSGRIVQSGTHAELREQPGPYAQLVELQAQTG